MTVDKVKLKALAEAFPADLDWDSNTEPFFNGPGGESLGGGSDGSYTVYGKPFRLEGEDYDYDGPTYVERCGVDFAKFMVSAREGVLALLAEIDQLKAERDKFTERKVLHHQVDTLAEWYANALNDNEQLKAKLMHQEAEAGTLAERMNAAGMMTVDELLAGAPLDAFTRHAGVNSLETFGQWLEMRRREYVSMQAKRTLDKREDDDLYEWVLAHAGVFGEVHINFKAAMAGHDKKGDSEGTISHA